MTTSAIAFIVALVIAVLLLLYNLRCFNSIKTQPLTQPDYAKKGDLTQNHWVITSAGDAVIMTAGESHDIIEFAFVWDLLIENGEQAQVRKQLFAGK